MSTPESATVVPATPMTTVRFTLPYLPAEEVFLAGSFNQWAPRQLPLTESRNGDWTTKVDLAPGDYEYLFIADGRWIADPNNSETRPNPHGGHNSVIRVASPAPRSKGKRSPPEVPALKPPGRERAK
jgi:1,4-alpha-glucan branching enzyme